MHIYTHPEQVQFIFNWNSTFVHVDLLLQTSTAHLPFIIDIANVLPSTEPTFIFE